MTAISASATQPLIIPPPLKAGDTVRLVAPAGIGKLQNIEGAVEVLSRHGWHVEVAPHARGRHGTYSGTVQERLSDLSDALMDPSVKAVICVRGGYGAIQLLDSLNRLPLRDNAKWLVGFSDVSALHALMSRHGIASVHGPMTSYIARHADHHPSDTTALFDILEGRIPSYNIEPSPLNRQGTAEGRLIGGNLAVLQALIRTPYDVFQPGTILFIEDISEPIYKVQRMLYQLKFMGVLDRLAGLIVGDFTRYEPDPNYPDMQSMIADMVRDYSYPVAFDFPVGHAGRALPLIENLPVRLTVTPASVSLSPL